MEDMCSVCATADTYKSVPPGKLACGHSRYKLVPAKSRPWRSGTLSAVSESLRLAKTFVDTVTATPTLHPFFRHHLFRNSRTAFRHKRGCSIGTECPLPSMTRHSQPPWCASAWHWSLPRYCPTSAPLLRVLYKVIIKDF